MPKKRKKAPKKLPVVKTKKAGTCRACGLLKMVNGRCENCGNTRLT